MRNYALFGVLVLFLATGLHAAEEGTSRLNLKVVSEADKEPVPNAHVVVRFVSGKKFFIKDKRTSWETKTNRRGLVVLDNVPQGVVKIQVIAKGYQTYGQEYELSKEKEDLTVLLKAPQGQLSAY